MTDTEQPEKVDVAETVKPKNKKYRKDKPWDTDDIDHWKYESFVPEDNKGGSLLEESSFATLFPKYREKYLREMWPHVTSLLDKSGINCQLDLIEGSMTVKTTKRTWDPYAIVKARDFIKLLSRSVPFPQAAKIMDDGVFCDVIKIGNVVRNKERFIKRRARLLGPNGNTLKAIELLTNCYVMVQGNTVSAMGDIKGLKAVRRIVEDCMRNVHPIYHIKELMIRRELMKDEKLKNESWDRFLPKFRKRNVQSKKQKSKKKEYTPFPPEQTPRKVDLEMESGEYFLSKEQKAARDLEKRKIQQEEKSAKKQAERMKSFVPPEDTKASGKTNDDQTLDLNALKERLKKSAAERARAQSSKEEDFVIGKRKRANDQEDTSKAKKVRIELPTKEVTPFNEKKESSNKKKSLF